MIKAVILIITIGSSIAQPPADGYLPPTGNDVQHNQVDASKQKSRTVQENKVLPASSLTFSGNPIVPRYPPQSNDYPADMYAPGKSFPKDSSYGLPSSRSEQPIATGDNPPSEKNSFNNGYQNDGQNNGFGYQYQSPQLRPIQQRQAPQRAAAAAAATPPVYGPPGRSMAGLASLGKSPPINSQPKKVLYNSYESPHQRPSPPARQNNQQNFISQMSGYLENNGFPSQDFSYKQRKPSLTYEAPLAPSKTVSAQQSSFTDETLPSGYFFDRPDSAFRINTGSAYGSSTSTPFQSSGQSTTYGGVSTTLAGNDAFNSNQRPYPKTSSLSNSESFKPSGYPATYEKPTDQFSSDNQSPNTQISYEAPTINQSKPSGPSREYGAPTSSTGYNGGDRFSHGNQQSDTQRKQFDGNSYQGAPNLSSTYGVPTRPNDGDYRQTPFHNNNYNDYANAMAFRPETSYGPPLSQKDGFFSYGQPSKFGYDQPTINNVHETNGYPREPKQPISQIFNRNHQSFDTNQGNIQNFNAIEQGRLLPPLPQNPSRPAMSYGVPFRPTDSHQNPAAKSFEKAISNSNLYGTQKQGIPERNNQQLLPDAAKSVSPYFPPSNTFANPQDQSSSHESPHQTHDGYSSSSFTNDHKDGEAKYEFKYNVNDASSGARFGQTETRNGQTAQGRYNVLLPDGRAQTVDYQADGRGFRSNIKYKDLPSEVSLPNPGTYQDETGYRY